MVREVVNMHLLFFLSLLFFSFPLLLVLLLLLEVTILDLCFS